MKPNCFQRVPIVIAVVLGLSMAAAEFYPVRELLAALIIFSVLFGIIGLGLSTLFLIQDLALKGVTYFESRMAYVRLRHRAILGHREQNHVFRSPRWN